MFAKSLLTSRLIFSFYCKIRIQKLSTASKVLIDTCLQRNLINIIHEQQVNHITSTGVSIRCFSSTNKTDNSAQNMANSQNFNLNYDDLLIAQKENVLIIDVRENSEIQDTGKLPRSIHIPMGEVVNALNLSNSEFQNKYQKEKPNQDTQIILSCRSGKRSAMVQGELQKLGYKNAFNYTGGWLEWESKQKA